MNIKELFCSMVLSLFSFPSPYTFQGEHLCFYAAWLPVVGTWLSQVGPWISALCIFSQGLRVPSVSFWERSCGLPFLWLTFPHSLPGGAEAFGLQREGWQRCFKRCKFERWREAHTMAASLPHVLQKPGQISVLGLIRISRMSFSRIKKLLYCVN